MRVWKPQKESRKEILIDKLRPTCFFPSPHFNQSFHQPFFRQKQSNEGRFTPYSLFFSAFNHSLYQGCTTQITRRAKINFCPYPRAKMICFYPIHRVHLSRKQAQNLALAGRMYVYACAIYVKHILAKIWILLRILANG